MRRRCRPWGVGSPSEEETRGGGVAFINLGPLASPLTDTHDKYW